jgi:hypothetical protein
MIEKNLTNLFRLFSGHPEILVRILLDRNALNNDFLRGIEDIIIDENLPEFADMTTIDTYCNNLLSSEKNLEQTLRMALDREDYVTASRIRDHLRNSKQ